MKRKPGHANVEEHPKGSGLYRVRIRSGKSFKMLASKLTKAKAVALADGQVYVRVAREAREGITLEQFGHGFFDRRRLAGVRGYKKEIGRWGKHIAGAPIGKLAIASIDRSDIVGWRDDLAGSYKSKQKLLSLLQLALDEAVERMLKTDNPARTVKIHKAGAASSKDGLEGILSPDEQRRLVAAVPARERPLVVFALCTGLRQAEQWWLHWEDVAGGSVIVRRSAGGLPPKSGKPREVPLLAPAAAVLAQLRGAETEGLIFVGARGGRRVEGRQPPLWPKWVKAAGIDRHVRWHDLRHTCATSLLAGWWGRKWTLDEVCKLLGHSSIAVTERYARKLNETLKNAVAGTDMPLFPSGNDEAKNMSKPSLEADTGGALLKQLPESERQHLLSGFVDSSGNTLGTGYAGWFGPKKPPATPADFGFLQADLGGAAR
jgi:integrase